MCNDSNPTTVSSLLGMLLGMGDLATRWKDSLVHRIQPLSCQVIVIYRHHSMNAVTIYLPMS